MCDSRWHRRLATAIDLKLGKRYAKHACNDCVRQTGASQPPVQLLMRIAACLLYRTCTQVVCGKLHRVVISPSHAAAPWSKRSRIEKLRNLQNCVQRGNLLHDGRHVHLKSLSICVRQRKPAPGNGLNIKNSEMFDRHGIERNERM